MAYESNLDTRSFEAGVDLSAKQYHFVSISSDGQIDPTGDGAAAVGVLQNAPATVGDAAAVATAGTTKIAFGGTVAAGAAVASDAAGKAVVAATGDQILGIAAIGGASGEIGSIVFEPRGTAA
jgi:hypothetical protein